MVQYYSEKLAAERLKKCYDIATPRIQQYLEAEIQHVLNHISSDDLVIELGCGYGRVLQRIAKITRHVVGIDLSRESLGYAHQIGILEENCTLFQMDAASLSFKDAIFDVVVCIQNGISAFKVAPESLLREALRVTRRGGLCLFSSYSDKFWKHRLEWFQLQSLEGLLGEIDWDATCDGVIACKDGFLATTFTQEDFMSLTNVFSVHSEVVEVDESSIFCEIYVR